MTEPNVQWDWWLCKTAGLEQITQLNSAHSKNLQLMLNQGGTGKCWLHIEDPKTVYVEEHKTSILCYRNKKAIWSGEIFDCEENVDNNSNFVLQITALGWFEILNRRLVHTGYEWAEMAVKASGRTVFREPVPEKVFKRISEIIAKKKKESITKLEEEELTKNEEEVGKLKEKELEEIQKQYEAVVAEKFYTPIATESAQQLYYTETPMSVIANDLIIRANIDSPTKITIGEVAPTNSINYTIQQFSNVGEQITKLTAIESGFDFNIDPLTRKFNTYRNTIRGGIAGLGRDRGAGVRFTYPGNCVLASRKAEGTKTQNRTEATGLYGVAKYESAQSIQENGLFEVADSLPEVVYIGTLAAFAAIETLTLEQPFKIVTFNPRAVNNSGSHSVPRPFEDYEIGDVVYAVINKGPRFQVGTKLPQPVRIYGFNVNIEDIGTEKITGLQTTYSQ